MNIRILGAKISSTILAAMVLLSTTGVVITSHYCQNKYKGSAFYITLEQCNHSDDSSACQHALQSNGCHHQSGDDPCCDDRREYLASDDEKITHTVSDVLSTEVVTDCFINGSFNTLPDENAYTQQYLKYKPPIVCTDILPLLQTYLC